MSTNRPTAAVIFILTTACLVITTLMTRQSGVASAASAEGQAYLGWASIAIHLGLPAFGIATGAALRAGNKMFAAVCMVLVILCALFSIRNVMNFVAAERISISKARDAEHKMKIAREEAALKAADQRQKTIDKMAQDQLAFMRTETKHADGRRERKDAMDAGTKFIQDYAKTEIVTAPKTVDTTVTVRPDAGAEMLAEFTGWNVAFWQFTDVVQIVAMLIIFETFGWPVGAYMWGLGMVAARANPQLPTDPPPTLIGGRGDQRMLSGPKPKEPKVLTIRSEPSPEWRQLLDRIEFPPAGARHKGQLRPRLDPETQALRFVCWLGAYDERDDYHNAALDSLYDEFLAADHREETALRLVKPALEAIRGKVASKRYVQGSGTMWHVQPPHLERMKSLLEKAGIIPAEGSEPSKAANGHAGADPEPAEAEEGAGRGLMARFLPRPLH